MNADYTSLFTFLGPDIGLTVLAFVVLGFDLVLLRDQKSERRSMVLGGLTAVALIVVMIFVWKQFHAGLGNTVPEIRTREEVVAVGDYGNAQLQRPGVGGDSIVLTPPVMVMRITLCGIALLVVLCSIGQDLTRHWGEYFSLLVFGLIGMDFMVMAEELIMIFVGLELTSLSLYMLACWSKTERMSAEAGMKYFVFGAVSSAVMYFGLSLLYGLSVLCPETIVREGMSGLDLTSLKGLAQLASDLLQQNHYNPLLIFALLFVVVGFGFKIAAVPFHLWAPDTYQGAPTMVTAYIATGSKVASFFLLLKVMFYAFDGVAGQAMVTIDSVVAVSFGEVADPGFGPGHLLHVIALLGTKFYRILELEFAKGWTGVLALMAASSMILGNFVAIKQRNVKRVLAYSSIAHSGYALIGIIAFNVTGAMAVSFYLIVYALSNIGAFGALALMAKHAGGDDLTDLNGMGRRTPLISLFMAMAVLSLAGIPPLGGFFGKFYLFAAAFTSDNTHYGLVWLVVIGIITSAVSLYYYLIILKHVYIEKSASEEHITESFPALCGVGIAAVLALLLGLFPHAILQFFQGMLGTL